MNTLKNQENDERNNSFHDFLSENYTILVLGGYEWIKRPLYLLILNVLRQLIIVFIWFGLCYLSIKTMLLTNFDKPITVELIQLACFVFGAVALQVTRYVTRDHLKRAAGMLKRGLIRYDGIIEEQNQILSERNKQIHLFIFVFKILTVCCLAMNNIFMPALRVMFTEDTLPYRSINRYLPLPVSMPFDTRTWPGYCAAYAAHAICYFFILITFVGNVQTSTSTAFQLCGEYEVLNYSLENTEKRAYYKYCKAHQATSSKSDLMDLYSRDEFQKCLYLCMRENIIHHQKILRLTKEISPYIEISLFTVLLYVSVVVAAAVVLILEDFSNNIALVMFLLSDAVGFLQINWVGQLVTNKSAETKLSLYSTPWYYCRKEFNKLFKIMQSYVQHPVVFKDWGFNIELSLETYGDMMSLGYKLVNLLR